MSKPDRDNEMTPVNEMTSPLENAENLPEPEIEEVENALDRLTDEEREDYVEYLRSSVRAQRDAEVLGHINYSR